MNEQEKIRAEAVGAESLKDKMRQTTREVAYVSNREADIRAAIRKMRDEAVAVDQGRIGQVLQHEEDALSDQVCKVRMAMAELQAAIAAGDRKKVASIMNAISGGTPAAVETNPPDNEGHNSDGNPD